MDAPKPAFGLLDRELPGKILAQAAAAELPSATSSVEHIQFAAAAGESVALAYPLPPAAIIDELKLSAVALCNRPGVQIAAEVVLPRSKDERTGEPRRLLVRSDAPADADQWLRLELAGMPRLLEQNVRVACAKYGTDVDARGAYVSNLVILAPGGIGPADVWIDEVALYGVLLPQENSVARAQPPAAGEWAASSRPVGPLGPIPAPPATPRLVQWQGESFALLKRLGFDGAWMARIPSETELAEARADGFFLICPPPPLEALRPGVLDERFDPVIAWDLGELNSPEELTEAERLRTAMLRTDLRTGRPMLGRSRDLPYEASRICDALAIGRPTAGASITGPEYQAWLADQRRLARPGTPLWVEIDADCGDGFRVQTAALSGRPAPPAPAMLDELGAATTSALAIQPRAFLFRSRSSLAAVDAATRMKRLALELTNARLGLVEPWLAAGKPTSMARSTLGGRTALVMQVERSHLIVPLDDGPGASTAQSEQTSFVLPGTPETSEAYLLTAGGPRQLAKRRVTGGLQITADRLPPGAFILVSEDGVALTRVEQYLRRHGMRSAEARVQLAVLERQLANAGLAAAPEWWLAEAGAVASLARADVGLAAVADASRRGDLQEAHRQGELVGDELARLRVRLVEAAGPIFARGGAPAPENWMCMGEYVAALVAVDAAGERASRWVDVPAGRFDALGPLVQAGWQRFERNWPGVASAVRVSPVDPADGAGCLELDVRATGAGAGPTPMLATPPAWLTSPPLYVPRDCLLEVAGLVRITEEPLASADPLLIFDSLGGEQSALRIATAPTWTPFRLVRAGPPGAPCRVTIALGGYGRAQVDSLKYRFIPLGKPRMKVTSRTMESPAR